jgi:hypothetical protein
LLNLRIEKLAWRRIMRKLFYTLSVPVLFLAIAIPSLADTIRLKDGSVIHGQVVGFKDQQFTVLIGGGSKGRRSRTTIYVEDVESIEFDATVGGDMASGDSIPTSQPPRRNTEPEPPARTETAPAASNNPAFFTIKVTVKADNTNNGWTNSGLVVRKGQRLHVIASGRVDLGKRRSSTPEGLRMVTDADKLMRNEPTGGLIGVIGDDNDDFIFLGGRREFVAQRDGVLFLGVNEGDLTDNSGTYDIVIEAEAVSGQPR